LGGVVAKTTVQQLDDFGQSVWIDHISRSLLKTGRLKELIGQGVRGLTSNPTIFDKAISKSSDYDQLIRALKEKHASTFEIYDDITVKDIQDAADLFRPIYEETEGSDGYVSLEIDPRLADDAEGTITEGMRLHTKVARPNLMLKVPATDKGFVAISTLLENGINVNATLIFSMRQYVNTAAAYLKGIENLLARGGNAGPVHSVASVFVSRIDTLIDDIIDSGLDEVSNTAKRRELTRLKGMAAVANSVIIYDNYSKMFSDTRFETLQRRGGNVQRLLWGSTSTKNPAYSDVKYVTELIGKGTVNTIPEKTLEAFLEHGEVKEALPGDLEQARAIIQTFADQGIDIDEVCSILLKDGVGAFQNSFSSLLRAIEAKVATL
jgi:transaldolase